MELTTFAVVVAAGICGVVVGWLLGSASGNERRARAEAAVDAVRQQLEASRLSHDQRLADHDAYVQRQQTQAKETHERALGDLRESFKALSADALKDNTPAFLAVAQENLGKMNAEARGDLDARKKEIEALLAPLQQQLSGYQALAQQSQKSIGEVVQQLGDVRKTSELLATETLRFRMVLKDNQARGKWGEETLRRVVEAAGMSAHCDFDVQVTEGDARPDMVVRLPEDRLIIVDAKVPELEAISALQTGAVDSHAESIRLHAQKLKATIKDLAARDYPGRFSRSLDYVVLFLPAESLFSAALEGDRDLIVWAAQQRIMIATPASLIALLRSVSVSWQQYAQSENTKLIADTAKELYQRVVTFYEHVGDIGDALAKAGKAFNKAVGSYETRVRPTGERLVNLKVDDTGKQLSELKPVDETLRLPKD